MPERLKPAAEVAGELRTRWRGRMGVHAIIVDRAHATRVIETRDAEVRVAALKELQVKELVAAVAEVLAVMDLGGPEPLVRVRLDALRMLREALRGQ